MSDPKHAAAERSATFGEVFADREYRAVYAASALSWIGDYLARAAVTALVFSTTGSVALSAASFAISYLPGLTGGPLLAAFAERYPNRSAMIFCDVARGFLIALVAIPHLPIPAVLGLLFATALLNPPFDASRSALLPRLLSGDRYVVAVSVQSTTNGIAQVSGYVIGGAMAPFYPHLALIIDAGTFLLSGALVAIGTTVRPATAGTRRRNLLRETGAGFRLVLANPVLRAIAAVVLSAWLFAVVPEGLAAAWAVKLAHHNAGSTGRDQALIMMAGPVGGVLGALLIGRFVAPLRRRQLIRPLAVLVPLALVPTVFDLPATGIALAAAISGFAVAGLIAPANGLFVQALPSAFRARAFGVMQFGLQLSQAVALFATGLLADRYDLPTVVGVWSLAGMCVMLLVGASWPSARTIEDTIARVRLQNEAAEHLAATPIPLLVPAVEAALLDNAPIETAMTETATDAALVDSSSETASDSAAMTATATVVRPGEGRHAARPSPRPAPRQGLRNSSGGRSTPTHRVDPACHMTDPQI